MKRKISSQNFGEKYVSTEKKKEYIKNYLTRKTLSTKKRNMPIKLIYSSHALDPEKVLSENISYMVGQLAPQPVHSLVQRVFHKSILRIQESLTTSMVESLNNYTKSGELTINELTAIDLEGEIARCRILMEHTLPPGDFAIMAPDSIRAVIKDLLHITRRQIMHHFANTFNSLQSEMGVAQIKNANSTAGCIMTFIDSVSFDRELN
jgi:hypothetical protein